MSIVLLMVPHHSRSPILEETGWGKKVRCRHSLCDRDRADGALGLSGTRLNSRSHLPQPGVPGTGAHIVSLHCGSEEIRDPTRRKVYGNPGAKVMGGLQRRLNVSSSPRPQAWDTGRAHVPWVLEAGPKPIWMLQFYGHQTGRSQLSPAIQQQ